MKRETRNSRQARTIDLGRASVETRGPVGNEREPIGKQPLGLSAD
ncbi:MAG TPA: benenodin family lasso peptide [Allosphingosinicella sp.]|jgi:hypothetical protein